MRILLLVVILSLKAYSLPPAVNDIGSYQTIDRNILFLTALDRFGFLIGSTQPELKLTPEESAAFTDIIDVANLRVSNLASQQKSFQIQFSDREEDFILNEGETARTAYVDPRNPLNNIFINHSLISNPNMKIDFIDTLQILLHELAHKTKHAKAKYVDSLSAKVAEKLRAGFHSIEIEPGYTIQILAVANPLTPFYRSIGKMEAKQTQEALRDIYFFSRIYGGNELTLFELRGPQITLRNSVSTYLGSLRGFYNVPNDGAVLETINLNQIRMIEKDTFGKRFPSIRIKFSSFNQIMQVSPSGVSTPLTQPSQLAQDFTVNQSHEEMIIHTNRDGIDKITLHPLFKSYMADLATLTQIEYKNKILRGTGELFVDPDELAELRKLYADNNLFLDLVLKFKGNQTSVPTRLELLDDCIRFQFEQQLEPRHEEIFIDNLLLRTPKLSEMENRFEIPLNETKRLNFAMPPANLKNKSKPGFEIVYWGSHDKNGKFLRFYTGPNSIPALNRGAANPEEINSNFNMTFLLRSETPIHELDFFLKGAVRIYDRNKGTYKFSRTTSHYLHFEEGQFYQRKIGPYYHIYVEFGMDFTPPVKASGNTEINEIESDEDLRISQMRLVNQNLEVITTEDPITKLTLNGLDAVRKARPNQTKSRFNFAGPESQNRSKLESEFEQAFVRCENLDF